MNLSKYTYFLTDLLLIFFAITNTAWHWKRICSRTFWVLYTCFLYFFLGLVLYSHWVVIKSDPGFLPKNKKVRIDEEGKIEESV